MAGAWRPTAGPASPQTLGLARTHSVTSRTKNSLLPAVKFRSIPPDPAEFPRTKLLWPPALPLLLLAIAWLADRGGHQWNIHGDGALLLGATFVLLIVGTLASLFTLSSLIPALMKHPTLRTRTNLLCTAVSVAFVTVTPACLIFGLAKLAV